MICIVASSREEYGVMAENDYYVFGFLTKNSVVVCRTGVLAGCTNRDSNYGWTDVFFSSQLDKEVGEEWWVEK
jgi:hypothetical protein